MSTSTQLGELDQPLFKRGLEESLLRALADTPAVLIQGARQTGKSTLVRQIATRRNAAYLTFDDATTLAAARTDPVGFTRDLRGPVVLDEVQKAPQLFPAIKMAIDERRTPGRFLLTGSAQVLLVPKVSESLVGRIEILTLWPFAQSELERNEANFVDVVFGEQLPVIRESRDSEDDLPARVTKGGYPEACLNRDDIRRADWFRSYVSTILQREVRDLSNIEGLTEFPRLLTALAARTGSMLNMADLSRSLAIPQTTLKRYLALLQLTFLVQWLPAWSSNLGRRLSKQPKVTFCDSGLLAYLLGYGPHQHSNEKGLFGTLLENFVGMELRKLASWSRTRPDLFHFHSHSGSEVDIVLVDRAGRVVGIEVKSAKTLGPGDFKGLRALAEAAGGAFHRGLVIYQGRDTIPFGTNLHALPAAALWRS